MGGSDLPEHVGVALAEVLGDEAGREPFERVEVEVTGEVAGESTQKVGHGALVGEEHLVGRVVLRFSLPLPRPGHRPGLPGREGRRGGRSPAKCVANAVEMSALQRYERGARTRFMDHSEAPQSMLAHLSQRLHPRMEEVAVEALGHILNSYCGAREVHDEVNVSPVSSPLLVFRPFRFRARHRTTIAKRGPSAVCSPLSAQSGRQTNAFLPSIAPQ